MASGTELQDPEVGGDLAAILAAEEAATGKRVAGIGPYRLAARRLRRNKTALAFGFLFLLIVGACLAAPLWAEHVAHTGYREQHLSDTITIDGEEVFVVALTGEPIGPQWRGEYFLGADGLGRDIMVRLLYGGRNSLMIGAAASLVTAVLAIILGLVAGYFRGRVDAVIRFFQDVIWAFPVILLGVALGTALALGGFSFSRFTFGIVDVTIPSGSLLIPIFIIAVVYVPYMARPLRGQVLALREKEFVEAARAQGAGPWRIMFVEILPNLAATIIVFLPLMIANAILLESALSFLGAGVRPPHPSWGSMIDEGVTRIVSAPHLALVPGIMIVLTVLALNVFGDGVRDALDPRAKVRIKQ